MLSIHRKTFPKGQTIPVPHYRIDGFDGKSLTLLQTPHRVEVDFSRFDGYSIARATGVQPEGWEIHGLIALDAQPLATALDQALAAGKARRFGTVLRDAWYFVQPIERHFTPQAGQQVVVGLYR
ncbi:hypothetical protein E7T06_07120 [Deinococcus sp. Arct2-2]|uniref:hypothetical protein n=1 Tax=Deinococcus sp. Arct2-2 TaxID=2568653 RepID=UPI0010A4281D|nr:hypothetical protein [Deinococcus sp. Arct2-2]THF70469.1 hypothetical protein E7T06_07120 [Deinococcus sp. Arct2-2]